MRSFTLSLMALCLSAALPAAASPQHPAAMTLSLERIGGHDGGMPGAAEITAFDAGSKRLFVVNGVNGTVDVLDLADPTAPVLVQTLSAEALGAGVNSVAVHDGLVALAVQAHVKTDPGVVALYRAADLQLLEWLPVGALPDMLAFTPDGRHLLVANEGEPNSYGQPDSVDPEGSVSVIHIRRNGPSVVKTADFRAFNGQEPALRADGIRLFGPGASAAQDFEPEYITVAPDGRTAYVTLQENNAVATVDIRRARITAVKPLGFKDHSVAGFGLDPSDEDAGIDTNSGTPAVKIVPYPVRGLYLPDAIASYRAGGTTYLVTANEGDARADWPGFNEETRVRSHCSAGLDPAVFGPDAARLLFDSNLGRLRITSAPNGGSEGKNAAGQCDALYSFGARSFSIWTTDLQRVYDSGDEFEQRTASLPNVKFNASHDNDTLDGRSASKGPEPEGVVLGRFGARTFAFIGLERVGGVMVYDVTDPHAPTFAAYENTRDGVTGDRGPEGLLLIPAKDSPNGKPLLVVGHEVSGTTAIYQIKLGRAGG
ncbi:choice-of-anchor I family protein [Piscinibacter sp.]|uniref:choice-of-anchor I family protein n=1 Tax=Piscinibacter sp. TaxID=1903157 RepID=UPI002B7CCF66|nr:choice-of-anchor I family protein [Albitalea sp.]HUG24825.1 choice-of-anchor I family protein [Albitalea sp.]